MAVSKGEGTSPNLKLDRILVISYPRWLCPVRRIFARAESRCARTKGEGRGRELARFGAHNHVLVALGGTSRRDRATGVGEIEQISHIVSLETPSYPWV